MCGGFNFFWRLNLFSKNFSTTKYVRRRSQKISTFFFLLKRLIDFLSCRRVLWCFEAFLYLHNFPFSILPRRKSRNGCRLISCYASRSRTRLIWDWKLNLLIFLLSSSESTPGMEMQCDFLAHLMMIVFDFMSIISPIFEKVIFFLSTPTDMEISVDLIKLI